MRRYGVILLCILLFLSPLFWLNAIADNSETIVYVTRTGYAYHREGCGHLRSKIEMSLREAVEAGYSPCEDCKPPLPDFSYTVATPPPRNGAGSGETHSAFTGGYASSGGNSGPNSTRSTVKSSSTPSPSSVSPRKSPLAAFLDSLPRFVSFVLTLLLIPLSWIAFIGVFVVPVWVYRGISRLFRWIKQALHH